MSNTVQLKDWYEETRKCIRCGLCRSVCPVFDAMGTEASVSRGKVQLIRALMEQRLDPNHALKDLVSLCLNCGACAPNCPSGIRVHEIILSARAELMAELGQPLVERVLLRGAGASARRMALGAKATALYQKTGLRWLAQKTKLLSVLPGDLQTKDGFVPDLPLRTARSKIHEVSGPTTAQTRVGYFLGCTSNLLEPSVAVATVKVLVELGCQVIVPSGLECCGMPHVNYGDVQTAGKLQRTNVDVMNRQNVEAVVVDCATCGSTLKRYEGLKAPVYDISEFLTDVLGAGFAWAREVSAKVTYHDPCHLARGQSIKASPRQLLQGVPGIELVEMVESDRCCGGGGSFNLTHYDVSMAILDRKTKNIVNTGASVIATGCPSCRMQVRYGLMREARRRRDGEKAANGVLPREVVHPVEVVARVLGAGDRGLSK